MRCLFLFCFFSLYLCSLECPGITEPYVSVTPSKLADQCLNKTPQTQINVLLDFYDSLNGQNWIIQDNWLNMSVSVCSWSGIICDSECNITQIFMTANNLKGLLPQLVDLPALTVISLLCNHIKGGITQFSNMTQLSFINMDGNEINEELPELSKLVNLTLLDLGKNRITGTIDDSILPNSVYLQTLNLGDNKLTGTLPITINNYSYLLNLLLNNNNFSGNIPELNLPKLQWLSLANNNLSGTIPPSIFSKHLHNLDLSNNQLSGEIPDSWRELKFLKYLYLNNNLLSGSFKTSNNYFPHNTINLSNNKLSGIIKNLINFQVDTLILSNNNFSGDIGTNFATISYLDIRNNYYMKSTMNNTALKEAFTPLDVYTIQDNLICNCVKIRFASPTLSVLLSDPQYLNYLYCKNITF